MESDKKEPDMSESRSNRGFWSLIVTQFQGAFSDNAFKTLVIFLVIGSEAASGRNLVLIIGALFAVPFLLFSMAGGFLADRYSKRAVILGTKMFEITVMGLAFIGLSVDSLELKIIAVFLMSVQSALFGPSKYGILPELLPEKLLSWGNGILNLGTFLAIITGTVVGGVLAEGFRDKQAWSGLIFVGLGSLGLLIALGVDRVKAADPGKRLRINFLSDLWAQIQYIRKDRVLYLAVLGNTYFYFLAALLQFAILFYGIEILEVGETKNSLLLASVALGIGLGSFAAGFLSGNKIEYGLIPIGSFGITVTCALLFRSNLSYTEVTVLLGFLGFASGFFAVPISALIQYRPDDQQRGGVIAASNLLSFVGIFFSSVAYYAFSEASLDPRQIFLASAFLTIGATVYLFWLLPDSLLRFLLWILTHSVYRIRILGRDNIPEKGGALFVSNHLSFVDALLLMASTDRPIRFIIYKGYYESRILKPFLRLLKAIPISSQLRPREMIHSLRTARQAVLDGEVVCIFAEGQITRTGQLLPFRRGFERIMKDVDAPIIPIHLTGVWGSIFSYERGLFFWKIPHRVLAPVVITFGSPLSSDSDAFEVRQAVQELHSESYTFHRETMSPLHRRFVWKARIHPFRFAMADHNTTSLRFFGALTKVIFLAFRLKPVWKDQARIGILLPPSVPGALVNLAALLMGKVPVNLNYTASSETIRSCAEQCKLETVITSAAFLEHITVEVPAKSLHLEELVENPRFGEKLAALTLALVTPVRLIEWLLGSTKTTSMDDLATIIFSSGSTGDPKGVMLSHYNINSNVEQVARTFFLGRRDRLLGILPFFHSFGFTGTLILPAVLGIGVVFHPTPLDARAIGDKVSRYEITFLLATPTFLQSFTRRCSAEEFGSLQFVMTGAEKLPERVAVAFEDKFGIRPLEGYGSTECSPVVSVNTRDFRAAGFRQVGAKRQTIGHPLPGVSVRIVDPSTGEILPPGKAGLLLVRGPNVMVGYLGRPTLTEEVLKDGWYSTGDIATQDEDGFLRITDRLSRFSKIGGEMVPHIKVEEVLHDLLGLTDQSFAVTDVPDSAKGERLVVLHTVSQELLDELMKRIKDSELPKLWIPRANQYFRVEELPYLGTGKMDIRRVKDLALELSEGSSS